MVSAVDNEPVYVRGDSDNGGFDFMGNRYG